MPDHRGDAPRPTAALLLIGNELLTGKVRDANTHPLAELLFRHGIALQRVTTIGDARADIIAEVQALAAHHTWVFTSGGVGPTHDDVTIEAVASALETRVITHADLAAMIRMRYGERCTDAHLRMASVPEGSVLETTDGDLHEWPAVRCRNVWIFPGVPEAFRMKLGILSAALRRSGYTSGLCSAAVFTTLEESSIVDVLDQLVREVPTLSVGSYPKWFEAAYKTKVTFDGPTEAEVTLAAEQLVARLPPGTAWRGK
jgi:molybdenum cofactor synthesis domain-containing protein